MFSVADISGDEFGLLPEGSIGPDRVSAERVVVLQVHNGEAQGRPSLGKASNATTGALLEGGR